MGFESLFGYMTTAFGDPTLLGIILLLVALLILFILRASLDIAIVFGVAFTAILVQAGLLPDWILPLLGISVGALIAYALYTFFGRRG